MNFIADYIVPKFFDWISEKAQNNVNFKKIVSHISPETHSDSLNQLLVTAYNGIRSNSAIEPLSDTDIEQCIQDNTNLLFEWVTSTDDVIPFNSDNIVYFNIDLKKQIDTVLKVFFHQILANRNNYPTLQILQINNLLTMLDKKVDTYHLVQTAMLQQVISQLNNNDIVYDGDLKTIEELVESRHFSEARTLAKSIEGKIDKTKHSEEAEKLYLLFVNSYLLDLGNQAESLQYFDRLLIHTTDPNKKQERIILQHILEKNYAIAQEKLNKIFSSADYSSLSSVFFDLQINVYLFQSEYQNAETFTDHNKIYIKKHQLWMAAIYIAEKNFQKAYDYLQSENGFFNSEEYDIVKCKIDILSNHFFSSTSVSPNLTELNKAKNLLQDIDELIELSYEDWQSKSYFHSIKGLFYSILNDFHQAGIEHEIALQLDANNYTSLRNYPFIYFDPENNDKTEKSIIYIKKYLDAFPNDIGAVNLLYIMQTIINPREAIALIENYSGDISGIKSLLIEAYDRLYEFDMAENIIQAKLSTTNICFNDYFYAAVHYERINQLDVAIIHITNALSIASQNFEREQAMYKLLRYTCFLNKTDLYSSTLQILEREYSRDYILIKYQEEYFRIILSLHQYDKCINACQYLRLHNMANNITTDYEFSCYFNTQNYQDAINVLTFFNTIPCHLLKQIAQCYTVLDETEKARSFFRTLPTPESAEDFIQLAKSYFYIRDNANALQVISEGYKIYPKNQIIMEIFIQYGMASGVRTENKELAALIGQCFQNYVNADFPHKILTQIELPKELTKETLQETLGKYIPAENTEERINAMSNSRFPITFYKHIVSKNTFWIYEWITHNIEHNVWCANGTIQDQIEEKAISSDLSIYIDIVSLLTLEKIGLLEQAFCFFKEIKIPNSVFQEIVLFNNETSSPMGDHGVLYRNNNDQFQFSEITNSDLLPIRAKCDNIRSIIKNRPNVRIVGEPITKKLVPPLKLQKLLDLIQLELDKQILLYSYLDDSCSLIDNSTIRLLMNSIDGNNRSFGTTSFLVYLMKRGIITKNRYYNSLEILLLSNYAIITIEADFLMFIIHKYGYVISSSFSRIIETLFSSIYDQSSVFVVLNTTFSDIWNEDIPTPIKENISGYILELLRKVYNVHNTILFLALVAKSLHNSRTLKEFALFANAYINTISPKPSFDYEHNTT